MHLLEETNTVPTSRGKWAGPVVLVPTMGALHDGHVDLIREARRLAGPEGTVVVSLFVNPLQFDRSEDLQGYPKTWEEDLATAKQEGVDALFAPRAGPRRSRPAPRQCWSRAVGPW